MFFSGLFQRKSDAPVTTPAELADAIGLSYDTYTGKQISSQRAMRLTAVFSCVRVLAESVGMLPCNLYHLNGSLKQRATGERLHKLISTHPNGYMTPQEFWELVVTCLCLRGNFYAYKVKAFGEVAELLPVDPGCVVPKLNSRWEPVYQVTFPDGSTDVLSQEDIWHVRTLTLDGLVGLNPIAYVHIRGRNLRTGNSDNSMKASDPRNAFYWRFVELGTINMPAHPFIRPAFDTTEELAAQIAIQRMNQAIDEVLSK
ncbi:TPA: phage portal protein [Escherichia coli]|nr:phage portal protein [Escherichia coli]